MIIKYKYYVIFQTMGMIIYTQLLLKQNKKYAAIFLCYRWLFIKCDIFIGEWAIFGAEVSFVIADFSLKATLL